MPRRIFSLFFHLIHFFLVRDTWKNKEDDKKVKSPSFQWKPPSKAFVLHPPTVPRNFSINCVFSSCQSFRRQSVRSSNAFVICVSRIMETKYQYQSPTSMMMILRILFQVPFISTSISGAHRERGRRIWFYDGLQWWKGKHREKINKIHSMYIVGRSQCGREFCSQCTCNNLLSTQCKWARDKKKVTCS